jgi:hypothetical protein
MRDKLGTAAIVLFVLVDIVLVTLAFRHVRPVEVADSPTAPAPTAPPPSASPPPATAAGPTYLSLAEDGTLLRATRGSCTDDAPPVVEVSTEGETFSTVDVDPDLREVLRVQADAADDVWMVGADARCRLGVYRGTADSTDWELSRGTGGAWHLLPDPEAVGVHAPDGRVDTPCRPVGLSTADGGVPRVLCADGTILGTADNGLSWLDLGRLPDAVAAAFASPNVGYALAAQDDCAAAVMRSVDGGASWQTLECLRGGEPLAIAVDGETVAALVGDSVRTLDVSSL